MGQFFSLNGPGEWEQTISEMHEPSIWSNVRHSPLRRDQMVLMERPGHTEFAFPHGIRQGGDTIVVSNAAETSLLVGFEETTGHVYAALLLKASEAAPHKYRRSQAEMRLEYGAEAPEQPAAAASAVEAEPEFGKTVIELAKHCADGEPSDEAAWPYLLLYSAKEGLIAFFGQDMASCEQVVCEVAGSYGPRVKAVEHAIGRAPDVAARMLAEVVAADLARRFAVRASADEQAECTNCVVFCVRVLRAFDLKLRGWDVVRFCETRPDLGERAGQAAGAAWDQLLRVVRD